MAAKLKELREKRAKLLSDATAYRDKHKDTGKPIPAEDISAWTKLLDDAEAVATEIRGLEKDDELRSRTAKDLEDLEKSRGRQTDPGQPRTGEEDEPTGEQRSKASKKFNEQYSKSFRSFIRGGDRRISDEEKAVLNRGPADGDPSAFDPEVRAQATTVNADGGYTVPPMFETQLSEALKFFGGVIQAGAEIVPTASGQTLPFPTLDDTSGSARIIDENAAQTADKKLTFGQASIPTFMYTSDVVLVPLQLIQDSFVNVEAIVQKKVAERLGRKLNVDNTVGAGTTEPVGIITALNAISASGGIGVTTVVNNAFTADELMALQHSVDPAYRNQGNCRYMMNDATLLKVRQLKDANGQYIIQDPKGDAPGSIFGKPYTIGTSFESLGSAKSIMAFGDFSHYKVRQVRGMMLFRFGELYMTNFQVGFCAFGRFGGGFVNPGVVPVKLMKTPA